MRHCKVIFACAALLLAATGESALAKRVEPKPVSSVVVGGVEYRAPFERMGCVEAWDVASGKMLWWRQIYAVVIDPALETDVQDVYVSAMTRDADGLVIKNERGGVYWLNPLTLEVKVRKGKAVLRYGDPKGQDR